MSRKALKVLAEIKLRAVSCPGVHLSVKDDVYLNMFFMDQFRQSLCVPAVFPLLIELVQLIPPAGDILAFFEEDARSFLFPEPKLVPCTTIVPYLIWHSLICFQWPGKRRNKRHATSTPHWTAEGERSVRMASPLSYIPRSQSLSPLRDGYIPSLALLNMGSAPCNPTDWETTSSQPVSTHNKLHERVQGLLTTPKAVQRLAYEATVSEADEVLARRFISAGPQT
uniref:Spermatogenesis-associated protein 6 N-terminal domain-containing protein n=1 Tax=Poecilia latipinna TaxID=48699 RepID=A0A3B3V5B6_9TELE